MKNLETRITINARPELVWSTLMDFASYNEWNPFVKSIEGTAKQGATIKVVLNQENNKTMTFTPVVLSAKSEDEFRWKGKLFVEGLFDGEHYFKLQETNQHTTELTHGEIFTGVLSGMLLKMIGKQTKAGFHAMNQALKARVENKNS